MDSEDSRDAHGQQRRYFVVNLGRSGSSLLAATLAHAGGDFGMPPVQDWDPRTGQMENVAVKWAAHHYRRAHDIAAGRKYILSPAFETRYRLLRGKRFLRRALREAKFLKIGDLDLVVQPAFKLGYAPRVILNYRQLEAMLPSLLVGRTHVGPDQLAAEYLRIYRQGLALMGTFGGCVVGYNALQDRDAVRWADSLSGVTGLARAALLEARNDLQNGVADPPLIRPIYTEAFALFEQLDALAGQVFEPSRQVERVLSARLP